MPTGPVPRNGFTYADAMIGALRLYVDNWRLFLLLTYAGAGLVVLRTVLERTGTPFSQLLGYVVSPLAFGFGILFYMALIYAVAKAHLNEAVSFWGALQAVFPKFWRGVVATVVFTLILFLGALLFLIPGVYWLTVIYFFMYLIVLEDKKLWSSFESSVALVKGHFWWVLGAHGLMLLVALALLMPFYMGMWLIGLPVLWRETVFQLFCVVLMPYSVGFYCQLYVWLKEMDRRAGHIAVIKTL
jgi:hypothetical protein